MEWSWLPRGIGDVCARVCVCFFFYGRHKPMKTLGVCYRLKPRVIVFFFTVGLLHKRAPTLYWLRP